MYGNPTFDCGSAQVRAHCRQLATVVTVSGSIDESNIDHLSELVNRFVLAEKPVILDLSNIDFFAAQGISMLFDVDDRCAALGVEWATVASGSVSRTLRDCQLDVPVMGSVPEALNHFADAMMERRRLLPILTKSA